MTTPARILGALPADSAAWGPCDLGATLARRLTDEAEFSALMGRHSEAWTMLAERWVPTRCGPGGGW